MDRDLYRHILAMTGLPQTGEFEGLVDEFADSMRERCGAPIVPGELESLGFSVMKPKTAALAFDRIYRIPLLSDPVPPQIGFYCGTLPEVAYWVGIFALTVADQVGLRPLSFDSSKGDAASAEAENLRFITSEFLAHLPVMPTLFYHARRSCSLDFPVGSRQVLTTAISNIALVDESCLTWDQVLEFRSDREARAKYCRLVRWLDLQLLTYPPAKVYDTIAVALDDYQWALRKHGLKSTVGALNALLDPKSVGTTAAATAAAAVAGGEFWASLAAGGLLVGQTAVAVATALISGLEERRKENFEIAYIYDVQERLGSDV